MSKPAFPVPIVPCDRMCGFISVEQGGMSLRDWFAGQALAGLCANPGGPFQHNPMCGWSITNCTNDDVGAVAVKLAEATLKALREVPNE